MKEVRRVTVWEGGRSSERKLLETYHVKAHDGYHAVKQVAVIMGLRDEEWKGSNPAFILRDEGVDKGGKALDEI